MIKTCGDCEHYEATTELCRAHPPVVHLIQTGPTEFSARPLLPQMKKDERSCGEFKQYAPPTPALAFDENGELP